MALTSPKEGEREVCLRLLARVNRSGPLTVLGDKGYAGATLEADAVGSARRWCGLAAKTRTVKGSISPRCASGSSPIYWSAEDILTLERHGARTLRGLRSASLPVFWRSPLRSP
jgi:hypothetical protein